MRRAKNQWDKKRGIWQPRISEEMVLREIVTRLWYQAKIKMRRINCAVGGKVRPNEPGIPDLIGVAPGGKAIFLEIKRPGGVHRIAQTQFINEVKSLGAIAGFVDSWDSCKKLFHENAIELTD